MDNKKLKIIYDIESSQFEYILSYIDKFHITTFNYDKVISLLDTTKTDF